MRIEILKELIAIVGKSYSIEQRLLWCLNYGSIDNSILLSNSEFSHRFMTGEKIEIDIDDEVAKRIELKNRNKKNYNTSALCNIILLASFAYGDPE